MEKAELGADLVIRFLVSLMLPVWGLAFVALGVTYDLGWWIACGAAIIIVGLLMLAGNPLADPIFRAG